MIFRRSSDFDAANWAPTAAPTPIAKVPPAEFHKAQFGGTLGGPIKKDKAFFFVNYEGLRQVLGVVENGIVPNASTVAGKLPCYEVFTAPSGAFPAGCATGSPLVNFGAGSSNAANYAIAQPYLALFPAGNGAQSVTTITSGTVINSATGLPCSTAAPCTNLPTGAQAYQRPSVGEPINENYVNGRVDYALSSSNSIFTRYVSDRALVLLPSVLPSFGNTEHGQNQYLTIGEKKIVNSGLVNSASFNFVRIYQEELPNATGANTPLLNFLGSSGLIRSAGSLGIGGGVTAPGYGLLDENIQIENHFDFEDDVFWTHGKNSFTIGGSIERVQSAYNLPLNYGGTYTFTNIYNFLTGVVNQTGSGQSTFSSTFPCLSTEPTTCNPTYRNYREIRLTPFIQDDWKVTKSLTLNLGMRYEFVTDPIETKGNLYPILRNLSSLAGLMLATPNLPPTYNSSLAPIAVPPGGAVTNVFQRNPTIKNFNPRVGFAWSPFQDHKTSLRGGAGVFDMLLTAREYGEGDSYLFPGVSGTAIDPAFNPATLAQTLSATATSLQFYRPYNQVHGTPYAVEYNLTLQHEVYRGAILSVGYVGSHAYNIINSVNSGSTAPIGQTADGRYIREGPVGGKVHTAISPYFSAFGEWTETGHSRYDALETSLTGKGRSMNYLVSYDYSNCLDETSSSLSNAGGIGTFGGNGTTDFLKPQLDYGPCDYRNRHVLKGNIVYPLPFHGSGWDNRLISGWQISVIGTGRTGFPVTALEGENTANLFGGGGGARPNPVTGVNVTPAGGSTYLEWFNPNAFTITGLNATPPVPGTSLVGGTYGTVGRNTITGPSLVDF